MPLNERANAAWCFLRLHAKRQLGVAARGMGALIEPVIRRVATALMRRCTPEEKEAAAAEVVPAWCTEAEVRACLGRLLNSWPALACCSDAGRGQARSEESVAGHEQGPPAGSHLGGEAG